VENSEKKILIFLGTANIPVTKMRCNIMNVPVNKQKTMNEEWNKVWKQINAITISDWTAKIYWHMSPADVWDTLFSVGTILKIFSKKYFGQRKSNKKKFSPYMPPKNFLTPPRQNFCSNQIQVFYFLKTWARFHILGWAYYGKQYGSLHK
jgi:hypothetical protein